MERIPKSGAGRSPGARSLRQAGWVWLLALALVGCGYSLYGGDAMDPAIRSVYVAPFANKTAEAKIETMFRNGFIDEIARNGRYRIAADEAGADAVLRGEILRLVTSPLAYNKDNLAMEQRLTVSLSLVFTDLRNRRTLWQAEGFSWYQDYSESVTDQNQTDANRKKALVTLSRETAERAYNLMTSDF
jgi:hypothetical protein